MSPTTALMDKATFIDFAFEIIRCSDRALGIEVIRVAGSMARLVHNYEERIYYSEAIIHIALPLLGCIVHKWQFSNGLLHKNAFDQPVPETSPRAAIAA